MKLSERQSGNFEPHPETDAAVKAVIVDVTPLKTMQSQFGEREVFKLVFESETEDDEGTRFCVWSRPYTPSLNPKANFRKDLKKILGRDLTAQELEEFDTESLIGMGAKLMIQHAQSEDGNRTFANIALIKPDDKPIKPSGKYTRVKDRENAGGDAGGSGGGSGGGASYRKTPKGEDGGEDARDDWQKTKVHVGKHKGVDLGDLDADAVQALIDKWLPKAEAMDKPKADDKRLMKALKEVQALLADAEEETEEEEEF